MVLLKKSVFLILTLKLISNESLAYKCKSKETCNECIQQLGCVWCINPKSNYHCIHKKEKTTDWCEKNLLEGTVEHRSEILEDRPFSSIQGNSVQIRPQKVKLSLRKNKKHILSFQYAQAENYPVDLYYIMDLSRSMKAHKENLAKLGIRLAETMHNITKNFKIGFGSFIDKPAQPFISTIPERLKNPCGNKDDCVPAYNFKNHLSLSNNYKEFSEKVSQARISGNVDPPEGGLDALMQAVVCKNIIGWRDYAKRLILLSTDADFHIAGDGRLVGAVEPNDAQCHLENNSYTYDLKLDYPSVYQINSVAKDNNINIIFAIAGNNTRIKDSYTKLSAVLENSELGVLDENAESVIDLVVDSYKKIVDSVIISSNTTEEIDVKIVPNCPHPKPNGCTDIHIGEVVNFTAIIKPLKCTSKSKTQTISIKPEALDEKIIVEVEVLCTCGCESSSNENYLLKSENCSKNGILKCGICDCDDGFFGENCQCNRQSSQSDDVANCKPDNDSAICSGLGTCLCGQCQCNKRSNPDEKISGKYCDCDNYSCKRVAGKLCSQRGTCECGSVCSCKAGWTGDACQCPDTNNTCVKADGKNLICNDHGSCNCGKCECFAEEVRYSGKYCDECPTCEGQRCKDLQDCVECQVHKTGIYNEKDCQSNCTLFTPDVVEKLDDPQYNNVKTCTIVDEDDCTFVFHYEYLNEKQVKVTAEKDKVCPGPPNILAWVLAVSGSILLAGLILLLIWKVCTTVHDRREYAKFENERQKMKWHRNENPLYKEPTSTFANPLYPRNRSKKKEH